MATNNQPTPLGGKSVKDFIKDLYDKDPLQLVRILDMMEDMYKSVPDGSQVAIDWQEINSKMDPDDMEYIINARNKYFDFINNKNVTDKTGYEGWDSIGGKRKVKATVMVERPVQKKATTWNEVKAHGLHRLGDTYITMEAVPEEQEVEIDTPGGTREQMFGKPLIKDTAARAALNGIVMPTAATAVATTGQTLFDRHKGIADYHSILGDAMYAMANRNEGVLDPALRRAHSAYYTKKGALEKANAAKELAKGAQQKDIAIGIATAVDNIARVNNARDEAARQAQLMINEHPVSDFYRDSASIRRYANSNGGTK